TRQQTDEQTFEDKQSNNARARSADCHSQCDFPATAAEADEQKIGDIAASDQQDKTDRRKKGDEPGANIFSHVLGERFQSTRKSAVDLVEVLRAITLVERGQCRARLLEGNALFHPPDHAKEAGAAHQSFVTEARKLKRFRRPNFRDRVRHAIKRNASPEHVWIATEAFLPEIPGD